jgi:hypothetical protein
MQCHFVIVNAGNGDDNRGHLLQMRPYMMYAFYVFDKTFCYMLGLLSQPLFFLSLTLPPTTHTRKEDRDTEVFALRCLAQPQAFLLSNLPAE